MFEVGRGQVVLLTGPMENFGSERRRTGAVVTIGIRPSAVRVLSARIAGGMGSTISTSEPGETMVTTVDVRGSYLDPGVAATWEVELQILADTLPDVCEVWSQSVLDQQITGEYTVKVTGEAERMGDLVIYDFGWEPGS